MKFRHAFGHSLDHSSREMSPIEVLRRTRPEVMGSVITTVPMVVD